MQSTHPIVSLFNNNFRKDIDRNFIDSLEAMLFLTPATKEDLALKTEHTLSIEHGAEDKSGFLSEFIKQQQKSSWLYDSEAQGFGYSDKNSQYEKAHYTVSDLLLIKVVENLKRLYAEKKSKNKTHDTLHNSSLIEQQNLIYQVFDMLEGKLSFDHEPRWYEKAVFGKHVQCTQTELLSFLGLHEQLSPENFKKHLLIYQQAPHEKPLTLNFVNHFKSIIFPVERKEFVQTLLKSCTSNTLVDSVWGKTSKSWLLSVSNYLVTNEVALSKERKIKLFNIIIGDDALNSKFVGQHISDMDNFITHATCYFNLPEIHEEAYNFLAKKTSIGEIDSNHIARMTFSCIPEFNASHANYVQRIFTGSEVTDQQKQEVIAKCDFSNNDFLFQIAKGINHGSGISHAKENMKEFLMVSGQSMNKALLSHIISMNSEYIEICKSAYMNIRLQEAVPVKEQTGVVGRKIKI